MVTLSIRVSEDPARAVGQAIVSVRGLPRVLEDDFEFALSRPGYAAGHLGLEGWQSAECWLRPREAWYCGNTLKLVLASELVFQLENRPYQLALRGPGLPETTAARFVWPLKLEPEDTVRVGAEPPNDTLPVLVKPSRKAAVDGDLPTRILAAGARILRSSRLIAADDEPTLRAPGRRISSRGNGARQADRHVASTEFPREPVVSCESSAPAPYRSASGEAARQAEPAGVTEGQRRRQSGALWIGLVVFALATTAATGWWWRSHPPAGSPTASEAALPEKPPEVRGPGWLKTAPEPAPAPEPVPAPEPAPAPASRLPATVPRTATPELPLVLESPVVPVSPTDRASE